MIPDPEIDLKFTLSQEIAQKHYFICYYLKFPFVAILTAKTLLSKENTVSEASILISSVCYRK